jgi:hypothetical protein
MGRDVVARRGDVFGERQRKREGGGHVQHGDGVAATTQIGEYGSIEEHSMIGDADGMKRGVEPM